MFGSNPPLTVASIAPLSGTYSTTQLPPGCREHKYTALWRGLHGPVDNVGKSSESNSQAFTPLSLLALHTGFMQGLP
eukprot:scaffold322559_cov51-Prasinocladus_malaysianus.AAC.1